MQEAEYRAILDQAGPSDEAIISQVQQQLADLQRNRE
jgi:hypothetical protein